jgi:hypothetical protein
MLRQVDVAAAAAAAAVVVDEVDKCSYENG